jgi:hypothetical protein
MRLELNTAAEEDAIYFSLEHSPSKTLKEVKDHLYLSVTTTLLCSLQKARDKKARELPTKNKW